MSQISDQPTQTIQLNVTYDFQELPDYWKKSALLNTFWIQNAQHFDKAFNLQVKLQADHANATQYAEIIRMQLANMYEDLHRKEKQNMENEWKVKLTDKDAQCKREIDRMKELHSQEITRLQDTWKLQKADQEPYIQQMQTRLTEQSDYVKKLENDIQNQTLQNAQLKTRIDEVTASMPKKLSLTEVGNFGEHDMEECIKEVISAKVINTNSIKNSTDRHFIGMGAFDGLYMLADAKYRWKDQNNLANPHINGEEVDTFLYSIKTHEKVTCALFLVLGDAKIPYKCQPVNYEIIPREGKPHLPVAWVVTRNQRTVHTAVLALFELQKQCLAIFENKHVNGKAQDVFKMYQEDMNKIKMHLPNVIHQLDTDREHSNSLCTQFQMLLTSEQKHKQQIQYSLEATHSLLENIEWTKDLPEQDPWVIFLDRYKEMKQKGTKVKALGEAHFSGKRRDLVRTAGIKKLNQRLQEYLKESSDEDETNARKQKPNESEDLPIDTNKTHIENTDNVMTVEENKKEQNKNKRKKKEPETSAEN